MLTRVLCASALAALAGGASYAQRAGVFEHRPADGRAGVFEFTAGEQPRGGAGVFEHKVDREQRRNRNVSRSVTVMRDDDTVLVYSPSRKGGTEISFADGELEIELRLVNDSVTDLEVELDGRDVDGYRAEIKDGVIQVLDKAGETVATINLPEHDGARHEVTVHAQARNASRNALEARAERAAREERVARAAASPGGGGGVVTGTAVAAPRRMIGISASPPNEALAAQLGLDASKVVVVDRVDEGLPAEKAGLRRFDVITEVNGAPPATLDRIREEIERRNDGSPLRLTIVRGGRTQTVEVKPTEQAAGEMRLEINAEQPFAGRVAERRLSPQNRARVEEAMAHARHALMMQQERLHDLHKNLESQLGGLADELRARLQDDNVADEIRRAYEAALTEIREVNVQEQIERAMAEMQRAMREAGVQNELRAFPEIRFFDGQGSGRGVVVAPPLPSPAATPAPPAPGAPAPAAPPAPTPPDQDGPGGRMFRAGEGAGARLEALEARMARIERLLERLAEDRDR